jgi:mannose-6-phosphate isomerase-like protein (cupin superfamily)
MSYGADDPRSAIAAGRQTPARPNNPAQFLDLGALEPDEISPAGSRTWWVRGQNVVIAHTRARAGERLTRTGQPDEYMVLFTDAGAEAGIGWGTATATVADRAAAVVPAGDSHVEVHADTTVVRIFSSRSADLAERCRNRAAYDTPDPNVTPFAPWPDPVDGPRIRVYPVADHPYEQGRFGRLFRCSTVMVNLFDADHGPRDTANLSPHHHDDFEQCSLTVTGRWVHHIRTPWTRDLADWRPDEHVEVSSPSVTVIPPPAVHTSRSVGEDVNQLIDVFCPPRTDFSDRPGWVLNAAEYPGPDPA